jgi:hypothetical protein
MMVYDMGTGGESFRLNPKTMNVSDWHNILHCAQLRKEQFGTSLRWPSMAHYHRYQREYDTYIMAGAMAARAKRLENSRVDAAR